jgi:uncharacterized protein (TIGR00369 family)
MTEQHARSASADSWGAGRHRSISWHDPAPTIVVGMQLSGLEYLSAMKDGHLPPSPIACTAGFQAISIDAGDVVYRCAVDGCFDNPIGLTHGGLMCTLLDSATASAVHSTLPAGATFATIELKVSYVRPVHSGDTVTAHGWVTKAGRTIAFAEADLRGPGGDVLATASSSLLGSAR